jgi:peptide/nickel transport system substrate-binding protein
MNEWSRHTRVSRRDVLRLGVAAAAGVAGVTVDLVAPPPLPAQTPKRGGVFRLRGEDPIGFDPQLVQSYRTMTNLSFTHSRLVKVKAGPAVRPGTTPIEADVAESWTQPTPTTYVFKLKPGVRWHPKPPLNGRELTADDVKYTYDRFLTVKGNPNRGILDQIDRIEALDRATVRFTLKEPNAWFLDNLASSFTWLIAREAVEQHGDLRKAESCIGTGPWMLERYEPNVKLTFVRNPHYFVPGLPYADGVEVTVDADTGSRLASWLSGKYDFAPEYDFVVRRLDLDLARRRKPGLQTAEFVWLVGGIAWMKLDQEPFKDIRVRRALALAGDWKETLETNAFSLGHGVPNPAVPAAFRDWSIPIDQLPPEGRKLYERNVGEAKRLLAEAGYPRGLKIPREDTPGFGTDYLDAVQIAVKNLKEAGVETELKLKEYGAYVATVPQGKFDRMAGGLFGAWTDPEAYLYRYHMPGQTSNGSGVNDPKLTEMIKLQRRTFDPAKRREVVYDIQRYLSTQVYHLYGPSVNVVSAWEPYVKNFAPNFGHDYGGRLMAAWLDK